MRKTPSLFPPDDPPALARLLSDRPLARALAARAREDALGPLGPDAMAARLLAIYEELRKAD